MALTAGVQRTKTGMKKLKYQMRAKTNLHAITQSDGGSLRGVPLSIILQTGLKMSNGYLHINFTVGNFHSTRNLDIFLPCG